MGVIPRVLSTQWNIYPHGDLFQEVLVAREFLQTGLFAVPYPGVVHERAAHLTDRSTITDKPPLWVFLISAIHTFTDLDTFATAKLLSLLLGVISFPVFYLLAKELTNQESAVFALAIYAASYLMIDVAGNGSRYMLQVLLILLIGWFIVRKSDKKIFSTIMFGVCTGLGFLVNYPFVSIMPVVFLGIWWSYKDIKLLGLYLLVSAITVSPWIGYNLVLYKTPLLATNLTRITQDSSTDIVNNKVVLHTVNTQSSIDTYLSKVLRYWYSNSIFMTKKLIILLPLLSFFLVLIPLRYKDYLKNKKLITFFLFTCLHVVAFISWRVLKFRYLTSIYPLLLLMAVISIQNLKLPVRRLILSAGFLFTAYISLSIYKINPYHTYYYNGVFTEDQFRNAGEIENMDAMSRKAAFSKKIPRDGRVGTTLPGLYLFRGEGYDGVTTNPDVISTYQIKYLWRDSVLEQIPNDSPYTFKLIAEDADNYLYEIILIE